MKKPKFNVDVFFKTFAKKDNITKNIKPKIKYVKENLFLWSLSCAYGQRDENNFDGLKYMTQEDKYINFLIPKKSFLDISKDLKYIPLMKLIDNDGSYYSCDTEYGYLYSAKSNISFIVKSQFSIWGDGQESELPFPIANFSDFNKKKFSQIPKKLLDSLNKIDTKQGFIVNFNKSFKWNIKLIKKIFRKSISERKKDAEEDEGCPLIEHYEEYYSDSFSNFSEFLKDSVSYDVKNEYDWYFRYWFFLLSEEKMNNSSSFPKSSNWKKYTIL